MHMYLNLYNSICRHGDEGTKSDIPIHITNAMLTDSIANGKSDSSDFVITTNLDQSKDSTTDKPDDTVGGHQRHLSQNKKTDSRITLLAKRVLKMQHSISSDSINIVHHNVLCCKISIIFSMCCIIGIFLMPIIFFIVNQANDNTEVDTEYSHEINTSIKEVCKPNS